MTESKKDIILFSNYNKYQNGLCIYTEDGVESFFIYLIDDGTIKTTRANNTIEEYYNDTQVYNSVALSILDEIDSLYKLLFVGYNQSNTKQVEYIFYTTQKVKEQLEKFMSNCLSHKIDGVGKEAEIVVNSSGGKQSKAIGRFDLIPSSIFKAYAIVKEGIEEKYVNILSLVLRRIVGNINTFVFLKSIIKLEPKFLEIVAKVLEEGASKYSRNNWRLIAPEDHFNHALIHLYALIEGDTQDDHYAHFLTRIAMFVETDTDSYDFMEVE